MIKYFLNPRISIVEFACILIAVEFILDSRYMEALIPICFSAIVGFIWHLKKDNIMGNKDEC